MRKLLVSLGIGVFLGLAFALTKTPSEPTYNGKRLGEWLADRRFNERGQIVLSEPSVEAVRAIGTKALPSLLTMLRSSDSPTKMKLAVLLARYPHLCRCIPTNGERRSRAVYGFRALGADAKPAFPDIVKMVLASDDYGDPINALTRADQDAITLLARGLEDKDPKVRVRAAFALGCLRQAPSISVPALTRAVSDPDSRVQAGAAGSLGCYGPITNHIPTGQQ